MKRIKRKQKFLKHLDLDLFSLFTPYKHLFLNKCLLIFSLLVCFYLNESQAQTVIQGHIKDSKGKSVINASVTLNNLKNGTVIMYDFSDEAGNYKLSFNMNIDSLSISVSGFNIAARSKRIKNEAQTVNFVADEKEIVLKEVIVKSKKIWGNKDTVNYLVSAFTDKKDFVIGDVLKKMPGINVAENGTISYQGRVISKFYIENLDLLQGRYGIATKNLLAKNVATLQILERHQSIKALSSETPPENAAINLVLTEEAKGKVSISGQLGVGATPLLWENELSGMRFAKKRQNIVTYKGNNRGVNLANEINSFFTGDNVLGIQMPSPPGIDQKRYLFNNSNALTVNNLFKTEKNSQFNLDLVYLNDHENRESNARSTYYIPGEKMLVIDEEMNSARNTDRLETELHYELNEDKRYLKNSLNISGLWNHSLGDVLTATNIHQKLKEPSFSVSDNFSWTKRTSNNKGFTLNSSVGFKSTPQKLMIYPGVYPDMFNNGHDYAMLRQDTRINKFYLNNNIDLIRAVNIGRFNLYPDLGLNFEYRNLNSSIYTQNGNDQVVLVPADSMRNDLDWMKWAAKADARISYRSNRLRLDFGFPVEYNVIQLNNKITSGKETIDKYFFEPWLQISYTVNANLKINGSYSFNNQLGDMMSLYPGYILHSYRSLNRYDSRLSESSGNGGYIGFEYKDIVNMFFINSSVSYNYSKNNILYGQNFRGILSVVSSIEQETSQNSISINGRVSKGIDWKKILFELVSSYGISSFQQLQQNMLIDCNSKGLNVSGSFSCRPVSLLDFKYKGDWGKSWSKIKTGGNAASFSSLKNNIDLDVNLPKDLVINLGFEHYYNSASLGNKNLSFADLGMTYIRKRIRYSLSWNNIFNTDSYTIASYGAVNSFQSIYHIRPANVMFKVKLILK